MFKLESLHCNYNKPLQGMAPTSWLLDCLLPCLHSCLLVCLLSCLLALLLVLEPSGLFRMIQKLFNSHSEPNDTDRAPVGAKKSQNDPRFSIRIIVFDEHA